MGVWYLESGPDQDVIVSTRIRLARNFKEYPFPARLNREQGEKIIQKSKQAMMENNSILSKEFQFFLMNAMNPVEKQVLVEKHLMSPEMLKDVHSRGLFLSNDEKISVMVNEEDHLRIQSLFPGMQLDEAWDLADKIDNIMEENIEYAYSENYGYLTSCPTNVGTGMRASVMMHLPALAITGYLNSLINAVSKLGIAVRGLYGEGTEAMGNIYQISNQVTLGISEDETLENLKGIVKQVVAQERTARKKLLEQSQLQLEDKLYRSYGIFTHARIMTSEEFMKLLSDVRLAVNLGIINDMQIEQLNELMVATQPANVMKRFGGNLNAAARDIKRTELIREKLKQQ